MTIDIPLILSAPPTAPSAFSVSESLARGLVARLVAEWHEQHVIFTAKQKEASKYGRIPKLPVRRALAYRVICERTRGLVPPSQVIIEHAHGKQDGMEKSAGFSVIHWAVREQVQRLVVLMTYVRPGWRLPRRWALFEMSTHALRRLFFRLGTLEQGPIFAELEPAIHTLCAWFPLLMVLAEEDHAIAFGIPTPQGILYLKRQRESADFLVLTWISDRRMIYRLAELNAVEIARQENGVVLQIGGRRLPLTPHRHTDLLSGRIHPLPDPVYQDMLRHLPPPAL